MTPKLNKLKHQPRNLRLAAFGAGVLATLAGGLVFGALATQALHGPDDELVTTFTPIEPCRLMDTRAGVDNVGPRATPLGADETYTIDVTGAAGQCELPDNHAGLALNATALNATAPTFLTFFPGGTERPLASNLNVVPDQPATPNKVDVGIYPNRELAVYNRFGAVDVVVDVTGYYSQGLEKIQMQLNALYGMQPFAMTGHHGGGPLTDDAGVQALVSLDVPVQAPGAIVAHSMVDAGSTVAGAELLCSISTTDEHHLQSEHSWEAGGVGLIVGSTAGHRTIPVEAGTITVNLLCQHSGAGTSIGIDEASLSVMFVPEYVPSSGPVAEAG